MNDEYRGTASRVRNYPTDGFQLLVVVLVALLVMGCRGPSAQVAGADAESQKLSSNSSAPPAATPGQGESAFDAAKTLSLANNQHPWDGSPKAPATKPVVPNGDSKPPELVQHSVASCSEQQPNRCVSCCDDFFSFGSEYWDQCVNTCPQLGLDSTVLKSEY